MTILSWRKRQPAKKVIEKPEPSVAPPSPPAPSVDLELVQKKLAPLIDAPCPVCQDTDPKYTISEEFVTTPRLQNVMSPQTYPHVLIICMTCGYERFFSGVILGLLRSLAETAKD